uniref:Uncharacterized protein LOC111136854 isoform X1 n=2 Tax=Crassostrea virginica TaxID=6565 RepID=A0A8B8EUP7_CRAVI|nr:uncharacterized protein LOC111136854 isoform X1 [Crassostrea virginica]
MSNILQLEDDLSHLILEEQNCSTLDTFDSNKLRNDRFDRNLQTMMAADSEVAKRMFSQAKCKPNDEKEKAAGVIQRYFRGHLGRKKYLSLLCEKFKEEQSIMQMKIKEQMEEGELLIENHRLEVLLDDNITTRKNRSRHYLADILTIQRAWRSYRRKKLKAEEEDDTIKDSITEKDNQAAKSLKEEETGSMFSSYSDMEDSVHEHLTKDKVDNDIVQCPGESEEDFSRRRRKVNYLSLAQEFAELQRKNSSATLSDQTENDKESDIEAKSVTKERKDKCAGNDFEVYTFRPAFDWGDLNQKIEQATQSQIHQDHDVREAICKKLAMDTEVDNERTSLKKSSYIPKPDRSNLQVCFMNEEQKVSSALSDFQSSEFSHLNQDTQNGYSKTADSEADKNDDKNFLMKQVKLQQEAKMALAQAGTMAHMQLEVEKELKKKVPNKNMVSAYFLEDLKHTRVGQKELFVMNLGHLQVFVNDLHTQIENLNEELMNLLMERDDLHMKQDSMLVDIEDMTRRAEDTAKQSH